MRPITSALLIVLAIPFAAPADDPPGKSLAQLVKDLDAPKAEQRIAAADAMRKMGAGARPVTKDLCRAVAKHPGKTRLACLDALKAIAPELHPHLETLAMEGNLDRHREALAALAYKKTESAPAVPMVLIYHQRMPAMLVAASEVAATSTKYIGTAAGAYSPTSGTYSALEVGVLKFLAAAAPDDPDTRSSFLAALKPVSVVVRGRPHTFPKQHRRPLAGTGRTNANCRSESGTCDEDGRGAARPIDG